MTTLLFNKPFDVITRFTTPDNAKPGQLTLSDFVSDEAVWPVGRLDRDSEGLLILSSDPRLRGRLLDPSAAHERSYLTQVEHEILSTSLSKLEQGIVLDGKATRPALARSVDEPIWLWPRNPPIRHRVSVPTSWIELTLTEGRNRQVRRMTAAVGHPCLRLIRRSIGPLHLEELDLDSGVVREATSDELRVLRSMVR